MATYTAIPWRVALPQDCGFLFCVMGLVVLNALRRFAEGCFSDAIAWLAYQAGSFGNLPAS
jgi:hypothetical protein